MGSARTSPASDQLRKDDVLVVWKLDRLSRSLRYVSRSIIQPRESQTKERLNTHPAKPGIALCAVLLLGDCVFKLII